MADKTSSDYYDQGLALMTYSISRSTRVFRYRMEDYTVPACIPTMEVDGLRVAPIDEVRRMAID